MLPGWDRISPAEKDVLRLMLSGLKVPAIADKLCRSPYTVQSQKVSMGQKLGVPGGGPNSFVNFILANYLIIKELLNEQLNLVNIKQLTLMIVSGEIYLSLTM